MNLHKNGRHCSTTDTVSNRPTWISSWGVRKMQKTMQSKYDTGPRIMAAGRCCVGVGGTRSLRLRTKRMLKSDENYNNGVMKNQTQRFIWVLLIPFPKA